MNSDDRPPLAEAVPGLIWHFGPCELDEARLLLKVSGAEQELERKPLEVLRHLLRHR